MKRLSNLFCLLICMSSIAQTNLPTAVKLSNGWSLSPAGTSFALGDLPLNIAVSPSKTLMAVTNNGQSVQSIQLIDAGSEKVLHSLVVPKSWYGLKFSADEKYLYAAGGHDNWIYQLEINNKKLIIKDTIKLGKKWPNRIGPAGLDIDDAKQLLYVVTRENKSLYIISLKTKQVQQQISLGSEAYTCLLSPDKKTLYISLWGRNKVMAWDLMAQRKKEWSVGDNPNEMCLTKDGRFLYVANALDNSVSVIDTREGRVMETLNAALFPDAPSGSTSNGVALSDDEKTLYVANADNNCLTVFDVEKPGQSESEGFIPVGWYPTNIKVIGDKIYVSNGKGFSSQANPYGPNPTQKRENVIYQGGDSTKPIDVQYIGGLFKGTMSIINTPDEKTLALWSKAVYENIPYTKDKEINAQGEAGNPIPMKLGEPSPIKYVFYVIKENRTYDQVLGDMPEGNGDTSLVLFGEKITPNQHALAREFILLDNFYVDGEVSADGHNWSLGAYATDYLEKTWPTNYGGRGGDYGAEGTKEIANNKVFLWDQCKAKGISYRTYGEFADDGKANLPVLEGHFCPYYTSWDESVKDTVRFRQWQREFDSLLAANAVPRLNTLRFINDHTEGLRPNRPTPFAHVADNDLAVGMFVEYLSKSSIWKETAIFIVEDDAQNGPDHVDAHRTTAYVAGGFVKRGYVDHTMYSTSSILRTIELILGLQPMSQYDAAATPMWRIFTSTPNLTPFKARPANIDLNTRNPNNRSALALKSLSFDFTKEDAAPDLEFSEVIWKGVKGEHSVMPAPRRAAFVKLSEKED
ncbi:MAG: bifunctional YncE family protein/alkaline phosphatase family protein [Chitinophagaceae bacterium]